ncbi:MAG TPA: hypothetical protein VK772_05195 [Puia sp.]|jgi:hypothetical protein|nr:hypothetical protein [Puia sp.]
MVKASPRRISKYYYLSLLCIFPGFGLIAGLVLIIYAIFIFRSWKLFFVILVTLNVGVILLKMDMEHLENDMKYGKETEGRFSILAADYLDHISIRLEDFKSERGAYPENLDELYQTYPDVRIIDPLLGRSPSAHKEVNFYYNRVGAKYILFSAGIDGIPNTADDIFPSKKTPPIEKKINLQNPLFAK